MSEEVIARANVVDREPTGKTRHSIKGQPIDDVHHLKIVKFDGGQGVYLIRYGDGDAELTDTFHMSVDEALDQAEFEYALTKDDWEFTANEQ